MQPVTDNEAAVVVHERDEINPSVLAFQYEREQVRLPELIGFGALERSHFVRMTLRVLIDELITRLMQHFCNRGWARRQRRSAQQHVADPLKAYVLFKYFLKPGPKFSINLSTLILLVIIAGGLLWLSVKPTYVLVVDSYGMGNVIYAGKRGWPYECVFSYGYAGASAHNQDALDKAVPRYLAPGEDVKLDFDYKALGLNLCINLAIISSIAIAQQHFRPREARKL